MGSYVQLQTMLAVAVLTLTMAFCKYAILNYLLAQVCSKTGTRVPNSDIEHAQYHLYFVYTISSAYVYVQYLVGKLQICKFA